MSTFDSDEIAQTPAEDAAATLRLEQTQDCIEDHARETGKNFDDAAKDLGIQII